MSIIQTYSALNVTECNIPFDIHCSLKKQQHDTR